jgi:hypothetical protein
MPRSATKTKPVGTCIYCGETKTLSEEHYLPECLGRFDEFESLIDRVCADCNGRIGRELEDQLCHAGEVGFMRNALGVLGKRRKRFLVNPFRRGSAGAPPFEMRGKIPGQEVEVRLQLVRGSETGIEYLPQLIIITESEQRYEIVIPDAMTEPDQLIDHLRKLEISEIKQARVIVPAEDRERIDRLLSGLKVTQQVWEDLPMTGATYTWTKVEVTSRYFRAIAKIGFHYMLKHFHFRGDEDIFADIRNFIINGPSTPGDVSQFVVWSDKQILEQVKSGFVPDTYCHIVIARATEKRIWAHLQFFLGRQSIPSVYTVNLGANDTPLVYSAFSGHQFCLFPGGPVHGKDGVMEPIVSLHKPPLKA